MLRGWLLVLLLGCGKDDKAPEPTKIVDKPVEPSPEQKTACTEAKKKAAGAWMAYGARAKKVWEWGETKMLPDYERKAVQVSKDRSGKPEERKAMIDAAKADVEAMKASIASYKKSVEVADKTQTVLVGATRDAKAASDAAAGAARDARDAATKSVAAHFDENVDGPGRAIWMMKQAVRVDPSDATKAKLVDMENQVGVLQKRFMQDHVETYQLADDASAAVKKIDDTCKGIP